MKPLCPVKESRAESGDQELRSPDPVNRDVMKSVNGSDEVVPEKSAEVGAEGQALVSPLSLGTNIDLFLACILLFRF